MNRSIWCALFAAACFTACSGALQPTPATGPAYTPDNAAGTTAVTFVVVVPGGARPQFISPSTQSVVVALGGAKLLTLDVSASSRSCKPSAKGSRTCTGHASASSGNRVFAIRAYDAAAGRGNLLASGSVSATLAAGKPQTVRVSLTGKPASVALSLQAAYPPAGTARTIAVTVAALDADGNTIVGSYGTHVKLDDSDSSSATKLSVKSVSNSSAKVTLSYDGGPLSQAVLSAGAPGTARGTAVFAPAPTSVAEFTAPPLVVSSVPIPAGLWDLVIGPDGNIWATDNSAGGIDKITPAGAFTGYEVLRGSAPEGISVGSDHNLWFALSQSGAIGKITTAGKITTYPIPVPSGATSRPAWTTLGPKGLTWFVDGGTNAVAAGTITSAGKITKYPLPKNSSPVEITAGPDGNLWITDDGLNAIVVMSPAGKVLAVHKLSTASAAPFGITAGPDKRIWFTEFNAGRIGRMTTKGALKEFTLPTGLAGPLNITPGPDSTVWFTESGSGFWDYAGKIGYINTGTSQIRDFPVIGGLVHVRSLVFDSSGILWYTEFAYISSALAKFIY